MDRTIAILALGGHWGTWPIPGLSAVRWYTWSDGERALSFCFSYPASPRGRPDEYREIDRVKYLRIISSPHRHPAGEQCRSHCGKLNRGHRTPGIVREQRVESSGMSRDLLLY